MGKNISGLSRWLVLVIFLAILAFIAVIIFRQPHGLILLGSGNPGEVRILSDRSFFGFFNSLSLQKSIGTGYKFVHFVRYGDIYNNNDKKIVAGVSNAFYQKPYGCKVMIYDEDGSNGKLLDDIGDLRCKDVSIGDAYNSGKNSVVLGTHGEGIINVYTWDFKNAKWNKEELERNFIHKIDLQKGTNHRALKETAFKDFEAFQNADYPGIIQSAVHNVRIGDVYNTGRNVVVATISSPLEYSKTEEISFIKSYEWINGGWSERIIDQIDGLEFRSIAIGKVKNGKNALVVGTGTIYSKNAKVLLYEWDEGKQIFEKDIIYNGDKEANMKGLDIADIDRDGQNEIALGTGQFKGSLYILKWDSKKNSFDSTRVDNFNKALGLPDDLGLNVLSTKIKDLDGDGKKEIAVAGLIVIPGKTRWEESDKGFLIVYRNKNQVWERQIFSDLPSILSMELVKF